MKKLLNLITTNFGFNDFSDFVTSFIHSRLLWISLPLAALGSFAEQYLGLQIVTLLAFGILLLTELITGLIASKVKGKKIESRKFARFGLKFGVWMIIFFILNSFRVQYEESSKFAYYFYDWLHTFILGYVNLEYLISVIENLGTITGNDNTAATIANGIKNKFFKLFSIGTIEKGKTKKTKKGK